MAVLNRDDWYDIARDAEWTLSYVTHKDAFPAERQGAAGIPRDAWQSWSGDRPHDPHGLLDDRPYDPSFDPSPDPSRDRDRHATDRGHKPRWLYALGTLLTPQRYPVHGLELAAAYVAQIAPSSSITRAAAAQAAGESRRVQRIARRTHQLDLAHPALGFGRTERTTFETQKRWQTVRAAIEHLLIAFEWDEAFTALELAIKPAYDEIFLRQLAAACRRAGDELDALVLDGLWHDAERARRWSTELVRLAVSRADHREAVAHHLARWRPLASTVLRDGAELVATHGGGDPAAIADAGERALDELCARAGLT